MTTVATAPTTLRAVDLTPVLPALRKLQSVEQEMLSQLLEREEVVHGALLAVLAQKHMLILGKPGSGKSWLVTLLAQRISPQAGGSLRCFVRLMTRFSKPEELFGPIDVPALKSGQYLHLIAGFLPDCELVFLDEVFKANSAILNSLLTAMEERLFDNGPSRISIPLISLFGASNEMPQGEDLSALYDRFHLRYEVDYVGDTAFGKLLRAPQSGNPPTTLSLAELQSLQQVIPTIPIPDGVLDAIQQLRKELVGMGIIASDRRWKQMLDLLRANALGDLRGIVEEDDLALLQHGLWMTPQQRTDIAKKTGRLANPLNAKANELLDLAKEIHANAMSAQGNGQLGDRQKMDAAIDAVTKIKNIKQQLQHLREQADEQARNPARIARVTSTVGGWHQELADLVL